MTCSTITFYVNEPKDNALTAGHAMGIYTEDNPVITLNYGFHKTYGLKVESYKQLDTDGSQCNADFDYSFEQERTHYTIHW